MIDILIILITMCLGCMGGQPQFSKAVRRWGITLFALGCSLRDERKRKRAWLLISLGGILSLGYGETSTFSKVFKKDWQRRIAYGVLLGLPFVFFGIWIGLIILPIAFSIRIPYSFKICGFEVLPEDMVRYASLGYVLRVSLTF